MYEAIHRLVDDGFAPMTEDLREILKVRSVLEEPERTDEHPFGPMVTEALDRFLAHAQKLGFATKNIDNMVGYAEIGEGPLFGVLVHLDVVPEGRLAAWKHHPYKAEIEDGKLYGRGTSDDKGPAVSILYAMKALRDSGAKLNRRFRVIAGLDEESGFRCMTRYRESEEIPEASFSPDAYFPVVNGEKGILHFALSKKIGNMTVLGVPELTHLHGGTRVNVVPDEVTACFNNVSAGYLEHAFEGTGADVRSISSRIAAVRVKGVPAHAMAPWKGENAIQKMLSRMLDMDFGPAELHMELIKLQSLYKFDTKGESLGIATEDEISGPLSCNLAKIELTGDTIRVENDIRYPVTTSGEMVINGLREAAEEVDWTLEILRHDEPLYVKPDTPLVRTLLDTYEKIAGERREPMCMGGGTYSRTMPNAVSFGAQFPEEEENAHQANEYIALDSLKKMTHIYAEALARFNENL